MQLLVLLSETLGLGYRRLRVRLNLRVEFAVIDYRLDRLLDLLGVSKVFCRETTVFLVVLPSRKKPCLVVLALSLGLRKLLLGLGELFLRFLCLLLSGSG